jgi:hypothetical protein
MNLIEKKILQDDGSYLYIVEMTTIDPLEFETLKYFAQYARRELEHRNRNKGDYKIYGKNV